MKPTSTKPDNSITERLKRRVLYLPQKQRREPTVYEVELADMLANHAIRQLCIYTTSDGYSLKVLPTWKDEFITLIGIKTKQPRQYKSLDRLLGTLQQHGPLPPTLLLGERSG